MRYERFSCAVGCGNARHGRRQRRLEQEGGCCGEKRRTERLRAEGREPRHDPEGQQGGPDREKGEARRRAHRRITATRGLRDTGQCRCGAINATRLRTKQPDAQKSSTNAGNTTKTNATAGPPEAIA
jgi:hypothetical protein